MLRGHDKAPHRGLRIARGGQGVLRSISGTESVTGEATGIRGGAEPRTLSAYVTQQPAVVQVVTLSDLVGTSVLGFRVRSQTQVTPGGGILLAEHVEQKTQATIRALDLHSLNADAAILGRHCQRLEQAAQVSHPHVLRVLGSEQRGRFLLIISECHEAMTLAALLAREKMLPEERALTMVQGLAEALAAGMQHGVYHGGVCPAHIMVTPDHKAILGDFCWDFPNVIVRQGDEDVALFENAAAEAATLVYRAPEYVVNPTTLHHQHDIYALGMTFYHMITGRPLLDAVSSKELLWMHKQMTWTPPQQVNRALSTVTSDLVMAMIADDPAQRLRDYSMLLLRLQSAILNLRSRRMLDRMKSGPNAAPPA